MVADPHAVSADALEDIAYLSRSVNRVTLLDALASGSYARRDLNERTGVARTTIGRIVNEFEERGWVERTGDGEYTATPTGEQVSAEFTPLVEAMAAIRILGDKVAWLQAPDSAIGLRHLSDATVRRPESSDPMAPAHHLTARLRGADELRCLFGVVPPVSFEIAMRDCTVEGDLTAEHVVSEREFAYVRDHPERAPRWREYVAAGANVYRYDGTVPCNLVVLDGTVYIGKSQSEYGEPYTVVETENDAVVSWACEIIERHRTAAERLDTEAFAEEA